MKRTELKRKKPMERTGDGLKRKAELARTEMKRTPPLKSGPVVRTQGKNGKPVVKNLYREMEHKMFRERARSQRACMSRDCENPAAEWQAHHVLYEQELRRLGAQTHNVRNAMRLCKRCHERHHTRTLVIHFDSLTDEHVAYVIEVLGERAMDYLRRHYRFEPDA